MTRRTIVKRAPRFWVERDSKGRFKKWISRSKSSKADRRVHAKRTVKSGYGHQGDQKVRNEKAIAMKFKVTASNLQSAWKKARREAGKNYTVTQVYWLGTTGTKKTFQCKAHKKR